MTQSETSTRGRESRQDSIRSERRFRGETDFTGLLQLGVDTSKLDNENYVYRWVNEGDNSHRLQQMLRQDWDVCRSADYSSLTDKGALDATTIGTAERRPVGQQKSGEPEYAYLCRKRKDWFETDRAKKHEQSVARMQSLKRGEITGGPEGQGLTDKDHRYIPDEGISITD